MDDDYFIAKPLKKSDFFYVNDSNVIPYIYGNLDNEKDFSDMDGGSDDADRLRQGSEVPSGGND